MWHRLNSFTLSLEFEFFHESGSRCNFISPSYQMWVTCPPPIKYEWHVPFLSNMSDMSPSYQIWVTCLPPIKYEWHVSLLSNMSNMSNSNQIWVTCPPPIKYEWHVPLLSNMSDISQSKSSGSLVVFKNLSDQGWIKYSYFSMFLFLWTVNFNLRFLCKSDLRISCL